MVGKKRQEAGGRRQEAGGRDNERTSVFNVKYICLFSVKIMSRKLKLS